jgi:hypothetical protein
LKAKKRREKREGRSKGAMVRRRKGAGREKEQRS